MNLYHLSKFRFDIKIHIQVLLFALTVGVSVREIPSSLYMNTVTYSLHLFIAVFTVTNTRAVEHSHASTHTCMPHIFTANDPKIG